MYGDLRRAPALETEVRRTVSRVGRGARPIGSMNTESVQQLFDDHESLLSDLGGFAASFLVARKLIIIIRNQTPLGTQLVRTKTH